MTMDFSREFDQNFEEHVGLLQGRIFQVIAEMYSLRSLLPTANIHLADIFGFFNENDPLEQLLYHTASREALRYGVRMLYIRWMGARRIMW